MNMFPEAYEHREDLSNLHAVEAEHVLSFFRGEGYEPGSFTLALLSAIAKADLSNEARLRLAFPTYVAAMAAARREPDGLERIRSIAQGEKL